jgi:hypothetical protein
MNRRDEVHWTTLKQIAKSPAHYRAAADLGFNKKSFVGGRLLHFLVLGGDYVIYEGKRQGNAWKGFEKLHAEKEIFTRAEVDREIAVANAVKNHPIAGPLLVGDHEVEIKWENMGRKCSSRLDVLNHGLRRAVDLKRAVTSEPDRFSRAARGYGYHAQGAFYQDACEFAKTPIDEYFVIAVEPVAPYAVTVFRLTGRALHQGRKLNRIWMERLLQCEAVNEWPEYAQDIIDLDSEEASDLIFGDEMDEASDTDEAAQ